MQRLDLRKNPYRGILKEIADERGVGSSAVHNALFGNEMPSPLYAEMFEQKLNERIERSKSVTERINNVVRKAETTNKVLLSVKEVARIAGVSRRTVLLRCKAEKYISIMVKGNGGLQYRIPLQSLPKNVQKVYRKKVI